MSVRVLLVKTSSLGDVVHLLPALTEAARMRPDVRFDWLVEPAFREVPAWHPAVERVFDAPVRNWRRAPFEAVRTGAPLALRTRLGDAEHDLVIDAQGLIKSALLATLARGERAGFDAASAREPLSAVFAQRRIPVAKHLHAVERSRRLLAAALGYEPADDPPEYGIALADEPACEAPAADRDAVLLCHGTTWADKHWPEAHWRTLAARLAADGHGVAVPWWQKHERGPAERIAEAGRGEVVARGSLTALLRRMRSARGVVAVDSGLLHMAAAVGLPGVALYGPTDPMRTGPWGSAIRVLRGALPCVPCLRRRCHSAEPVRGALFSDGRAGDRMSDALEPPCLGGVTPTQVQTVLARSLDDRS